MTSYATPLIVISIVSVLAIIGLYGKNPLGPRVFAINPPLNNKNPARAMDIALFFINFKRSPPVNMITNYSKAEKNNDEI